MKQLLLTLMGLIMATTAMADSYFYMDDIVVRPSQQQITVPINAHFNGRVSAFEINLTYPEGLTPSRIVGSDDINVNYIDNDGSPATQKAVFMVNDAKSRVMSVLSSSGYWDPDGDGTYESYGVIKWEAGDYEKMALLVLTIDENFDGGEIVLETEVASGSDTRGGTVTDLGESGLTFTQICTVSVEPDPMTQTESPVISYVEGDLYYTIMAEGQGEVRLYIDGVEVENPYVINRTDEDKYVVAQATAQAEGQLISDMAELPVVVHALPVPTPPDPESDYTLTMADAEVLHGQNVVIPVSMTNAEEVTAFQTDLYLPEGFELLDVVLSSRKSGDHGIYRSVMADGAVRLLCYSLSLNTFEGNEGELFYITVKAPNDAAGDYTLMLKKSLLTTAADNAEVRCDDNASNLYVWPYIPGDANMDGEVTVTDIVVTANYILGKNPQPFDFMAADMNGDGEITVTDVVLITRIILNPSIDDLLRAPAVMGDNNDAMNGEDLIIANGETRTVSIALDNEVDYTAFQLDMQLPDGLTAKNFRLTDRAGSHALDANVLEDGTQRVMCYSPALSTIDGHKGALLTFDVIAMGDVNGEILVNGIEMVTANCQTVNLDNFAMKVNNATTSVKDIVSDLRIYTDGYNIIVETSVAQRVVISDVAGRSFSVDVPEGRTEIPARNSGVVVVNAGDKTAKLMIK